MIDQSFVHPRLGVAALREQWEGPPMTTSRQFLVDKMTALITAARYGYPRDADHLTAHELIEVNRLAAVILPDEKYRKPRKMRKSR